MVDAIKEVETSEKKIPKEINKIIKKNKNLSISFHQLYKEKFISYFFPLMPIFLNCSAIINLWDSPTINIGSLNIEFWHLNAVSCNNEYESNISKNCFGFSFLEIGHNLVPEPPAKIKGVINFVFFFNLFSLDQMRL